MTQLTLVPLQQESQPKALKRVTAKLQQAIIHFCQDIGPRGEFYAEDLLNHVERYVGKVAPDSPGRVLRQLRRLGAVDYVVINRRNSHYRIVRVGR